MSLQHGNGRRVGGPSEGDSKQELHAELGSWKRSALEGTPYSTGLSYVARKTASGIAIAKDVQLKPDQQIRLGSGR